MSDPEKQETTAAQSDPAPAEKSGGGAAGGDIGLTMSYITSIPGILKIVEFVCIFFTLIIVLPNMFLLVRMTFATVAKQHKVFSFFLFR